MNDEKAIFYKNIYGTNKASEIKSMMLKDFNKIKSSTDITKVMRKYMPFIYLLNTADFTKQRFIEIKKIIEKTKLPSQYKNTLKNAFLAPNGFYKAINELRELRLKEKEDKNSEINFDLKKFDEIIKSLYEIGMDKSLSNYPYKIGSRQTPEQVRAYYLATYLALTTGRRFTEILKTMKLRKYKENLRIKGILKKNKEDENRYYNLIALDNTNKIYKAYKELRNIFDTSNLTEKQVNQKHSAKFNHFLKTKIFQNTDFTFHDLRKIYLLKAYEKFGDGENFDNFAEKALIHDVKLDAKFLTQTSHYTNTKIKDDTISEETNNKNKKDN